MLNYIGDYDYYLEKKPEVEAAYLNKPQEDTTSGSKGKPWAIPNTNSAKDSETVSNNKLSWQQQKEEQARIRKRKNELKKTEDEIHALEIENDEIDALLIQEEIYTNPEKLMELHSRKKQVEARLEELLELWEQLAAEE